MDAHSGELIGLTQLQANEDQRSDHGDNRDDLRDVVEGLEGHDDSFTRANLYRRASRYIGRTTGDVPTWISPMISNPWRS